MKIYDCIFLDRDGTINPDPGYISSIQNFNFFDFTIPALKQIAKLGNRFCIVTNQSGVSRGLIKQSDLDIIHHYIEQEFKKYEIPLLNIALPVGISFYTFQTISYTVDIYRGKLKPSDSFLEFESLPPKTNPAVCEALAEAKPNLAVFKAPPLAHDAGV